MIYGSSRIQVVAKNVEGANPGPTGNRGNTGNTGPTGPIGITGNTGNTSIGISGATVISGSIVFYGSTLSFTFGSITGSTGTSFENSFYRVEGLATVKPSVSANIVVSDNNASFDANAGVTVFFKGVTISGFGPIGTSTPFVGVSHDNNRVYIFGATVSDSQLPLGNTGELLYINSNAGFGTSPLKAKAATNTKLVPSERQLIIDLKTFREAIFSNKNWNATGTTPYSFTNFNDGLNYYLGYSGDTYGTSVVETYTNPRITFGSTSYELPYDGSGISFNQFITLGLSSGTTMEKLSFLISSGIAKGNSYSPQNLTRDKIGSCCFCKENFTDKVCLDYVSQDFCNAVSGVFDSLSCVERSTSSDCYYEGACCVYDAETGNSRCINTTAEKCAKFGGLFNEGRACDSMWINGELFTCPTNLCVVGQNEIGRCCVSGKCFNLGRGDCNSIAGAIFVAGGTCTSQDADAVCCEQTYNLAGACCVGAAGCIDDTTPGDCTITLGGVFQGPGTTCREVTCCGSSFAPDYFKGDEANSCKAYGEQQIYSCLRPGDKIGGGYFVGFIGVPNPCDTFNNPSLAFGEPLECLCNPRGTLPGVPNWYLRTCKGVSGADNTGSIEYFARTYPRVLPKNALDSRCLLKAGVPFVQQAYALDGVTWPSEIMFEDGFGYNPNRAYSYSLVDSGLAVEYFDSGIDTIYQYLGREIYDVEGAPKYQIMWALIIAPEDIEVGSSPGGTTGGNRLLSWGMMQGSHKPNPIDGSPIANSLVLEEVPTFPVDGLLNTRIHDGSSRNNPDLWFRGTTDPNAYNRFSFGNGPAWSEWVKESEITTNKDLFKIAYADMWSRNNPIHSAIYQVTNINGAGLYGYNDWYIPSIIELNYIYNNLSELNAALAVNDDQILNGKEYWSSTSVSRLKSWDSNNPLDKDLYRLENLDSYVEPYLVDNPLTSQSNYNLTSDDAYKFMMAVSNGQKMLTQVFEQNNSSTRGMMRSRSRSARIANFRPVRRIPLVVTCEGFYYSSELLNNYWNSEQNGCASCLDYLEGMCS